MEAHCQETQVIIVLCVWQFVAYLAVLSVPLAVLAVPLVVLDVPLAALAVVLPAVVAAVH